MEPYVKSPNTKRFVVEDSITKVTSDGEPHEMMTMIAGLSGLVVAIVILAILVSLVGCKRKKRLPRCSDCPASSGSTEKLPCGAMRGSVVSSTSSSSVYTRTTSISSSVKTEPSSPRPSIAIIHTGNLKGNMNSAFVGSEFNLSSNLCKPKKKTHWSDEVEVDANTKETRIAIERY